VSAGRVHLDVRLLKAWYSGDGDDARWVRSHAVIGAQIVPELWDFFETSQALVRLISPCCNCCVLVAPVSVAGESGCTSATSFDELIGIGCGVGAEVVPPSQVGIGRSPARLSGNSTA
jgi:hypothetical protein